MSKENENTRAELSNRDDDNSETASVRNSKRVLWIDVLRGITMLLVVYSHVNTQIVDLPFSRFNSVIVTFRMPLFFFISGFFIYNVNYDLVLLRRRAINRLYRQLYPTVIFFTIYVVLAQGCGWREALFADSKAGYWFTYLSVLYFFTLGPVLYIFSRYRLSDRARILWLFLGMLAITAVSILLLLNSSFLDSDLSLLISFKHYLRYMPCLLCGSIFRILWDRYGGLLMRLPVMIFCVIAFCLWIRVSNPYMGMVTGFFGIYIMVYIFHSLSGIMNRVKWFGIIGLVGSMTLEIYLLHYFLLMALKESDLITNLLPSVINTPFEFPVYMSLSVAITAICLVFVWILKKCGCYMLLFGKESKGGHKEPSNKFLVKKD